MKYREPKEIYTKLRDIKSGSIVRYAEGAINNYLVTDRYVVNENNDILTSKSQTDTRCVIDIKNGILYCINSDTLMYIMESA